MTSCQPSLFQVSGGRFQSAIFVTLCDEGTCDSDVCTVQLIAVLSLTNYLHWLRPLGPPCLCSLSLHDVSPCATWGQPAHDVMTLSEYLINSVQQENLIATTNQYHIHPSQVTSLGWSESQFGHQLCISHFAFHYASSFELKFIPG